MIPSSVLCRAREDFHRREAAGSLLENARLVAINAAAAWAREAVAAEYREERHRRARLFAVDAAICPSSPAAPGEQETRSRSRRWRPVMTDPISMETRPC